MYSVQESGYPDINLVCEKLAFEGVTRFEDRHRMPMGICVNLTAYAAKLCFQAAYNPMIIGPYRAFGTATEWTVQDASDFSADGEELSFWQMQVGSPTFKSVSASTCCTIQAVSVLCLVVMSTSSVCIAQDLQTLSLSISSCLSHFRTTKAFAQDMHGKTRVTSTSTCRDGSR